MSRAVIEKFANGDMLVMDRNIGVFDEPHFHAYLITTEMKPTTVCKPLGHATTHDKALALARLALNIQQRQEPK